MKHGFNYDIEGRSHSTISHSRTILELKGVTLAFGGVTAVSEIDLRVGFFTRIGRALGLSPA